jgi:L-2-hydroxyglutarate oxidase
VSNERPYDVVVIGGGIVGLATARSLLAAVPSLSLALVEKEAALGSHQTGHNSGVLHTGVYYRPGSLKSRLCADGRRRMSAFCEEHGLPLRVSGKLIVAVDRSEVPRLEELQRRADANGVAGVERLGPAGIAEHEPHAAGVAALWVPETGVTDFAAIAARLGSLLTDAGAAVLTGFAVDRIEPDGAAVAVAAGERRVAGRFVVNAAGLFADVVARLAGDEPPARIVPFRGEYRVLAPEAAGLVRSLVYPVPDPRFPFLGVHFTRGADDVVEVGPNAVPALGREHYRGTRADWRAFGEALRHPGFRRLAVRHARSGLAEIAGSVSRRLYARRARRLIPEVRAEHLLPGGSGVRAQAVLRDGTLADDFVIGGHGPFLHVISAPSPAATAALSIGDHLAAEVRRRMAGP